MHEFIYLPVCPIPLMERDLLAKMGAQISFPTDRSAQLELTESPSPLIMALTIRREEEWCLYSSTSEMGTIPPELETEYSLVWAKGNPQGLAKCDAPILIDLKPRYQPVKLQQHSIPREAQLGIQIHLDRLLQQRLLIKCQYPCNTPSLTAYKKTGNTRLPPGSGLENCKWSNSHLAPPIANPYILLGLILPLLSALLAWT